MGSHSPFFDVWPMIVKTNGRVILSNSLCQTKGSFGIWEVCAALLFPGALWFSAFVHACAHAVKGEEGKKTPTWSGVGIPPHVGTAALYEKVWYIMI